MSLLYRRYLRLLENWPVDQTKKDRDLGEFIRNQIKIKFSLGELKKEINENECIKTFESLQRITNDYYRNKYVRRDFSSTGLNHEQCKVILTDDFLQLLQEDEKGFIKRLFKRVKKS